MAVDSRGERRKDVKYSLPKLYVPYVLTANAEEARNRVSERMGTPTSTWPSSLTLLREAKNLPGIKRKTFRDRIDGSQLRASALLPSETGEIKTHQALNAVLEIAPQWLTGVGICPTEIHQFSRQLKTNYCSCLAGDVYKSEETKIFVYFNARQMLCMPPPKTRDNVVFFDSPHYEVPSAIPQTDGLYL